MPAIDPTLLTAVITGLVTILTTFAGIWASNRRQAKRAEEVARKLASNSESQLQRIAVVQSEHAFASVRQEVDRYRQEVDRLRADNDRLVRLFEATKVQQTWLEKRMTELEKELADERVARREAEARADSLMNQIRARTP